jgi:hypothetical protein
MARQALVWTALPNGYGDDGTSLRLSVLLSPRLDPEASPHRLDSFFPDWEDWPATLASCRFEISLGADKVTINASDRTGPDKVDDRVGLATSSVWKAIFKGDRLVRPYAFRDLTGHRILSYDVVRMADRIADLYARLAEEAGDELPTVSDLLDDEKWGGLIEAVAAIDRASADRRTGLRDPARQFARLGETSRQRLGSLELFQLFHTPPTRSAPRSEARLDDPRIEATWREHERATLPSPAQIEEGFDFHQLVAAMGNYPSILRRLGLVVDLVIGPGRFQLSANAPLQVAVIFPAATLAIPLVGQGSPVVRTRLTTERFEAVSAGAGPYRIDGGLLALDPAAFRLQQMDVDGAGLKLLNFARTLGRHRAPEDRVEAVSRKEVRAGVPALRTGGLMLVHSARKDFLGTRLTTGRDGNTLLEGQIGGASTAPVLHAEDVTRGYRIDVWDDVSGAWHSLCRRTALFELEGGITVESAPEEETTLRLAATRSPDPSANADVIYLHEVMMSWTGWSLAAPPPGRAVRPDDGVDESTPQTEAETLPGISFKSRFRAVPGSLPRLRFGRRYAVRARGVDLAGNALSFRETDFAGEDPESAAVPYLRFEPLAPPVVTLLSQGGHVGLPSEGESVSCMAIRSFNDTPDLNGVPSTETARRGVVPPQVSAREAEQHGMLDRGGKLDAALFTMLAVDRDVDPRTPQAAVRKVVVKTKGPTGEPADTTFAVWEVGRALTYLPDPLAIEVAARISGLPGVPDTEIVAVPLYVDTSWPDAQPFEIELSEDTEAMPTFDAASRRLKVYIPKGTRARLRLSMRLLQGGGDKMALLGLLDPARRSDVEARARDGQHWMITPWHEVDLVHAVQKPLIAPDVASLIIDRVLDQTSARPVIVAACHLGSTDRVDLHAAWHEPLDAPGEDGRGAPVDQARTDLAFAVKISRPEEYAQEMLGSKGGGHAEHVVVGDNAIGINVTSVPTPRRPVLPPKQHELGDTRYRRVVYHLDAVSRFREFLPRALLMADVDGRSIPIDTHVKVSGKAAVGWIPNSAPPPAPAVLYVVPTFGWSRIVDDEGRRWSERSGGGLRVYLDRGWNASGYGEMLAVVLPPAGFEGDPDAAPAGQPYRTLVTQWGNDPAWDASFVEGLAPGRRDFPRSRLGPDPSGAWLPPTAPATEADQPPDPFPVVGLRPARSTLPDVTVEIAPHDVAFDAERGLWFCDIVIDSSSTYFPFVRLALARYQPTSVPGAHLSVIVLADVMALAPNRSLSIVPLAEPGAWRVTLFGVRPWNSSGAAEAANARSASRLDPISGLVEEVHPTRVAASTIVEVAVETCEPTLGEDFGWRRAPNVTIETAVAPPDQLGSAAVAAWRTMWSGTVHVTGNQETALRLAIAEYEEYLVDDDHPYDGVPRKSGRRLVYLEYVPL